ncbi:hypothetical protein [Cellulomonas terrae]|uniref:Uncharacterized protein n=1 Tax=Cellulomonas terrae TaxID=311234 RepID=A0A511JKS4_9CELL|nr:hypothetical protein [Cellulomonas terrae]GEL98544.1 hypothetical protein CTE05_20910 [Cellulomonas terrae]
MIRTLTEDDALDLERVGYERGDVLRAVTGRPDAHRYRLDPTNPLVVDGLVLLEEDSGAFRFLDTLRVPLTVRDLRRFRVLVKVSEADRTGGEAAGVASQPTTPDLVDLRDDALDNDLVDGVDFAIGATAATEAITFEDGYVVGYRDAGTTTTLFTSRSFAQARAVFLDEACWLGAERGRGPYVGRDQAVGTEGWTSAQVVAAYERRLLEGV